MTPHASRTSPIHYKEPGVVYIFQFRENKNLAHPVSFSIFCAKLEAYCALRKIPYQTVTTTSTDPATKKLPFAVLDGEVTSDSRFVISMLKAKFPAAAAHHSVDPQAAALGHLVLRTCEDSLNWAMVFHRWIGPHSARFGAEGFEIPALIFPIVRIIIGIERTVFGQGFSRLTPERQAAIWESDFDALDAVVAGMKGPFLTGSEPCDADAVLFATVANMAFPEGLPFCGGSQFYRPKGGLFGKHTKTKGRE
jgi:glutathione S-transferase